MLSFDHYHYSIIGGKVQVGKMYRVSCQEIVNWLVDCLVR